MIFVFKRAVIVRISKRTKCCVIGFYVFDSVCLRGKFFFVYFVGNGICYFMILEVRFIIKLFFIG